MPSGWITEAISIPVTALLPIACFPLLGVAALWLFKGLIPFPLIQNLHDAVIARAGVLLLFIIPLDLKQGTFLLDGKSAIRIPWEVIIRFGGGFALAHGLEQSGLTLWIVK